MGGEKQPMNTSKFHIYTSKQPINTEIFAFLGAASVQGVGEMRANGGGRAAARAAAAPGQRRGRKLERGAEATHMPGKGAAAEAAGIGNG